MGSGSAITSHPFRPDGDWWERCAICKLAESAHAGTTIGLHEKLSDRPYRCPDCVSIGREICPHRRERRGEL